MDREQTDSRQRKASRAFAIFRMTVIVILILGALFGYRGYKWFTSQPAKAPDGRQPVSLKSVIDGDTIRVLRPNGEEVKVRLIGIDCAELGKSDGFRSALYCAELLESSRELYLEPDPRTPYDQYKRMLGWVFIITPQGDELLLQEEMVKAGMADLFRDAKGSKYYTRLERARH